VLITGASSGIGAACAEYFASEGARLALVENDPLLILRDIATDAQQIIDETIQKYNRLDVLINNAGFAIRGTVENTKIENFDAVMATNVRAVFLLTHLAVPFLKASKGNVVNVSSVGSLRPYTNNLAYCMSKAAVDHFTRCAALELSSEGVRVNCVNPGLIATDFHLNLGMPMEQYVPFIENFGKQHPIGRHGQAPEVVNAIAFLSKENSGFVTGVCLPIDGGMTISNEASLVEHHTDSSRQIVHRDMTFPRL
ncbi:Glucose 1-dehydrogenase, partial [Pseudolycoriella hygida]